MCLIIISDRKYACIEVPASSLYKYNLQTKKITLYNWQETENNLCDVYSVDEWFNIVHKQQDLPDDEFIFDPNLEETFNDEVRCLVQKFIKVIHKLCILLSFTFCINLCNLFISYNNVDTSLSLVIKLDICFLQ